MFETVIWTCTGLTVVGTFFMGKNQPKKALFIITPVGLFVIYLALASPDKQWQQVNQLSLAAGVITVLAGWVVLTWSLWQIISQYVDRYKERLLDR